MGTRADFYVGIGKEAEWLGSIAYDGFPNKWGHPYKLLRLKNEKNYRKRVKEIIENNLKSGAVFPDDGWPWPWENSETTDYSYYFYKNMVMINAFGKWIVVHKELNPQNLEVGSGLHKHHHNVNYAGVMLLSIPILPSNVSRQDFREVEE